MVPTLFSNNFYGFQDLFHCKCYSQLIGWYWTVIRRFWRCSPREQWLNNLHRPPVPPMGGFYCAGTTGWLFIVTAIHTCMIYNLCTTSLQTRLRKLQVLKYYEIIKIIIIIAIQRGNELCFNGTFVPRWYS